MQKIVGLENKVMEITIKKMDLNINLDNHWSD